MRGEIILKRTTDGVAVSGLAMPVWWPSLHEFSVLASELVPILSALWLAVQIVAWLRKRGQE